MKININIYMYKCIKDLKKKNMFRKLKIYIEIFIYIIHILQI